MRIKRPDRKNAQSMIDAAERDMAFTLSLPVTVESSATIVRNIYESFRMLGDALLVHKGITSEDHITPIQELLHIPIKANRPTRLIDNMRRLRHNINYYAYNPREAEVLDTMNLAKELFPPLSTAIRMKISESKEIN